MKKTVSDLNGNVICVQPSSSNHDFELIERKGIGHPDTLADALAEELSRTYSNYTLSLFGAILHHNFDKVGLLGGRSYVTFGEGHLTRPIRVLLNGRASTRFADKNIPVRELLEKTARDFLVKHFPTIDKNKDIETHFNLSNASSPGNVDFTSSREGTRKYWFEPRGLHDLREQSFLGSNDTSIGCSYAPLSTTERIVLELERHLNSPPYRKKHPWLGSDIKIMAFRCAKNLDMTIAIPQIGEHVSDIQAYRENLRAIKGDIIDFAGKMESSLSISLHVNTRDDFDTCELYLTAIGSSIESGDEGLVGRGNRSNGLITPCRPMSIEAACGKNPVYWVGKLYNIAAQRIAQRVYESTGNYVEVFLVSQSGRLVTDPWKIVVATEKADLRAENLSNLIEEELQAIPTMKDSWLKGEITLF